jgi:hypothetical protein
MVLFNHQFDFFVIVKKHAADFCVRQRAVDAKVLQCAGEMPSSFLTSKDFNHSWLPARDERQ